MELAREIMRRHSGLFDALPSSEQQRYHDMAPEVSARTARRRQGAIDQLESSFDMHCRQREEEESRGHEFRLSDHFLTEEDYGELLELYNDLSLTRERVEARMSKQHSPPQKPPVAMMQALLSIRPPSTSRPISQCLRVLCKNRDDMPGTAIGVSSGEGASFYVFLHATQSPI